MGLIFVNFPVVGEDWCSSMACGGYPTSVERQCESLDDFGFDALIQISSAWLALQLLE
jgi:hypothetical protein